MNIPKCIVCGQPAAFPTIVKEPWTCITCQRAAKPTSAETAEAKLDCAPRTGSATRPLTLTIEEIRDLAEYAGILVTPARQEDKEDERETEIAIAGWPEKGVWDEEQTCQVPPHKHLAYFEEYPEEGCVPLGSPNAPGERPGQEARELKP